MISSVIVCRDYSIIQLAVLFLNLTILYYFLWCRLNRITGSKPWYSTEIWKRSTLSVSIGYFLVQWNSSRLHIQIQHKSLSIESIFSFVKINAYPLNKNVNFTLGKRVWRDSWDLVVAQRQRNFVWCPERVKGEIENSGGNGRYRVVV